MYTGMAMLPNQKAKAQAVPRRKVINLLMDHAKWQPAKKPPPVRHWDAMSGTLVTEDLILSMREDELHRDIFSTEERVQAFRTAQAQHMWARENNAGYPDQHGLYVFSAKMGKGKSLLMEAIALAAWMYHAVPVFSTASSGLLFGYKIELEQLYQVSDVVPQGSIIVLDEVAALADNFGGQAMRSRTLGATMTAFRKEGLLILAGSAAEWNIAPALKIAAEAIVTPSVYRPTKEVIVDYDDHWDPIVKKFNLRDNELDYPPFCYLKADALVTPWERRRVREDFEHEKWKASLHPRQRERINDGLDLRWKDRRFAVPGAKFLYFASKLYDTHSRVPITDQHFISADKMRAEAEARRLGRDGSDPATRLDACLRWSLGTTAYDDYWMKGKVPLDELRGVAIHYDKRTFKRMTKADFQKHLGELLASPGAVTRRNVDLEAIVDYCRGPAHKPGSAPAGSAGGEESE